jgi:hypothetical protein
VGAWTRSIRKWTGGRHLWMWGTSWLAQEGLCPVSRLEVHSHFSTHVLVTTHFLCYLVLWKTGFYILVPNIPVIITCLQVQVHDHHAECRYVSVCPSSIFEPAVSFPWYLVKRVCHKKSFHDAIPLRFLGQ